MQSCIYKVDQRVNLKMKSTAVAQVRDKATTPRKNIVRGCEAHFPKPLPYLYPNSVIITELQKIVFSNLFVAWKKCCTLWPGPLINTLLIISYLNQTNVKAFCSKGFLLMILLFLLWMKKHFLLEKILPVPNSRPECKICPIYDQNGQNWYNIYHQNGWAGKACPLELHIHVHIPVYIQ